MESSALYNIAMIYQNRGNYAEAICLLEQVIAPCATTCQQTNNRRPNNQNGKQPAHEDKLKAGTFSPSGEGHERGRAHVLGR